MNPLNPCFTDNYKRLGPLGDRGEYLFFFIRKVGVQEVHRGSNISG
jgi:hypothetical protein